MPDIGRAQFLGAPSCVPVWSKATILRTWSLYIMVASLWQHGSSSYSLGSANIHLSRPPVLSSGFPTFWSWWQEFCHPGLTFREPGLHQLWDGPFGDLGVLLQTSILQLLPGGHFRENQSLFVPLILFPSLHQKTRWDDGGKSACSSDCPPWPKLPALSTGLQSRHVRTPGTLCYQTPPMTGFGLKDLQHLGHGRLFFTRLISNNKPFPWAPWPFSSWPWYPSLIFLIERNRLGYLLLISPHPLFLLCTSLLPIA